MPCRTYPFWAEHIASPVDWKAESVKCPGIGDDAPQVPELDVVENAIIHEVNLKMKSQIDGTDA